MSRISWDELWMDFALLVAKRSTDPKFKVGACIVNRDNTKVLSIGYNGDEAGGLNERLSMEQGKSGFIHAEINALIKCDYSESYKKLYVTHSPCEICAKALINGGVSEVNYLIKYNDQGLNILEKRGIKTRCLGDS